MEQTNLSTRKYLEQYFVTEKPGFAVLVAAPWGAGKTHFIQSLISEVPSEKPLYVSLFGVSNRQEFDRALLRAKWPKTESEGVKFLKQAKNFVSAINVWGVSADLSKVDITEFVLAKLPNVLIFDDIERATFPVSQMLGAINSFVEHQGKHVVLLANEENLWKAEDRKQKEKLVGQTLSLVADFEEAIHPMIARFSAKTGEFLINEIDVVRDAFTKADYNNLRSLGQALWEFERLFVELEEGIVAKTASMRELLFVFLALTLEVKSGNFSRDDLRLRGGIDFNEKPEFKKLRAAQRKYQSEQIMSGTFQAVFPYKLACRVIIDGVIDRAEVNRELSRTSFFLEAEAESEWQTVWWASHREESLVGQAVEAMETKFAGREYTDPGIVLHVFSVRMKEPEMGYSSLSLDEIEKQCHQYVDDLLASNNLLGFDPIREAVSNDGFGYSSDAYNGLGFPSADRSPIYPFFSRLLKHMRKAQMEVYDRSGKSEAVELFNEMKKDVSSFVVKVSGKSVREAVFRRKPILRHIDPDEFSATLVEMQQDARRQVLGALYERHRWAGTELDDERGWIRDVDGKIKSLLDTQSQFASWQIGNDLKFTIGQLVTLWDGESGSPEAAEAEVVTS